MSRIDEKTAQLTEVSADKRDGIEVLYVRFANAYENTRERMQAESGRISRGEISVYSDGGIRIAATKAEVLRLLAIVASEELKGQKNAQKINAQRERDEIAVRAAFDAMVKR